MFKRETIKFLIPTSLLSLSTNATYSNREVIPLYINPRTFNSDYSKIISEQQTIGGFIIQYWGENITNINIAGTTGSGGIDAINILHSIYKSEQTQFKKMLLQKQKELSKDISNQINSSETTTDAIEIASAIDQVITNGVITDFVDGVSETMDFFKEAITGNGKQPNKTDTLLPTLSAFAVSLDMHYQGKVYRGFIKSMTVSENADSPGLFDYTMSFRCLKEYGERNNFMPWHTDPYDLAGNPKQKPKTGSWDYNLTFPFLSAKETSTTSQSISKVTDDQTGKVGNNDSIINRYLTIKK